MTLRVLGCREDGGWIAHCLETDLVGRGDTFAVALKELQELTEMQVSFALETDQPSLLDHPAPPDVWETYNRLFQDSLRNLNKPRPAGNRALGAFPLTSKSHGSDRLAWCGA